MSPWFPLILLYRDIIWLSRMLHNMIVRQLVRSRGEQGKSKTEGAGCLLRLQLIHPVVKAGELVVPKRCPHNACSGICLRLYQKMGNRLKDTVHRQVTARRHQCVECRRTFRVYPRGETNAQTSQRVKGLAAPLYLPGLSHGAVSLTLEALGCYMCKSRVGVRTMPCKGRGAGPWIDATGGLPRLAHAGARGDVTRWPWGLNY